MAAAVWPAGWLIGLLLILAPAAAAQTVYRWVDEDGGVHYGDQPDAGREAEAIALPRQPDAAQVEAARQRQEQIRTQANELADQRIRLETERLKAAERQQRELEQAEQEQRLRRLEEEAEYRSNWSWGIPWYRPRPPHRPPGQRPPGDRPGPPVRPQALKPPPK